jgi:hypothetical protein
MIRGLILLELFMESGSNILRPMTIAEGLQILLPNVCAAAAVAVGLAFLLKLVFTRAPLAQRICEFLPWRSAVAMIILWFSPIVWLGTMTEPMRMIVQAILDRGGLDALTWTFSSIGVAAFTFAVVVVSLVHHWFAKSLVQKGVAALRTGAVIATVLILLQQMIAITGSGGAIVKAYGEYSFATGSMLWKTVFATIFSIDILLGVLQIGAGLWARRQTPLSVQHPAPG